MKNKILVIIITLLLVLAIVGIVFSQKNSKPKDVNTNNLSTKIKKENRLITFIYNVDTCKECSKLINPIKKYSTKYNYKYTVYAIDKNNENKYVDTLKKMNIEISEIQNTYIIYTENGKIMGMSNGIIDETGLTSFFDYIKIAKN